MRYMGLKRMVSEIQECRLGGGGLAHVGGVAEHSLGYSEEAAVSVLYDDAGVGAVFGVEGDEEGDLFEEGVGDVVDAGFGEEVVVDGVGEGAYVSGGDD